MRRLLVLLFASSVVLAQKGSAPPGFYPGNYNGDTFTGSVVQTTADTIVLEYRNGGKGETFTGSTEKACMAPVKSDPHQMRELHLPAIPAGSVLTVFYNSEKIKQPDGTKVQKNVILALRFDEVNGQKLTNPNRPVIMCSEAKGGLAAH